MVGGTSAEFTLKTLKLATTKYLDRLPSSGNEHGRAFRDHDLEAKIFELARQIGVGAQFGGKYFAHDVPRHPAAAARRVVSGGPGGVVLGGPAGARADHPRGGVPGAARGEPGEVSARLVTEVELPGDVVRVDLNRPMPEILGELTRYPVATRLSLSGPMIVARDIAHAKLKERLDAGEELPAYAREHMVYYAGPAKRPEGRASGSFGPTTAGRMDSYVDLFQSHGGSMVMLAKGNRSAQVTEACRKHGGFYLGSIGGPAARLADHSIRKVDVLEYPRAGDGGDLEDRGRGLPRVHRRGRQGERFFRPVAGGEAGHIDPLAGFDPC